MEFPRIKLQRPIEECFERLFVFLNRNSFKQFLPSQRFGCRVFNCELENVTPRKVTHIVEERRKAKGGKSDVERLAGRRAIGIAHWKDSPHGFRDLLPLGRVYFL